MESLFSLLALPYDAACGRYPLAVEKSRIRLQPPADGNDGDTLLAIGRLLRLLSLPARLSHFQRPEPAALSSAVTIKETPHPDAAEVLERCRQHYPRWRRASIRGLELVYRLVLKERCESAIQRGLMEENAATRQRVRSAINIQACREAEDDPLVVWAKLVWRFPANHDFDYLPEQIAAAWSEAVCDRNRVEALGSLAHESLDSLAVANWMATHNTSPWQLLGNVETIETCFRRHSRLVRCYIYRRLSSWGDWPEELLNSLKRLVENEVNSLSPDQEKRCRRKLHREWHA